MLWPLGTGLFPGMTSFLARAYAFKFFDAFILIFPLYAVMFVDAGLTPVQIAICLTVWSATSFALQIPSGVIADRVSRRHVLAYAQAGRAAGFLVWLLWPHFWGFLFGLVLWGVKSAFTSGTFEALFYDELRAAGRADDYTRLIGRTRAAQAGGVLLASLGAAFLSRYGYAACLIASLGSIAVASVAALALPPADRTWLAGDKSFTAQLGEGLALARRERNILNILAFSAAILAFGAALEEFWPIFGAKVGLPRPAIAVFVGAQNAIEAVASLAAYRLAALGRRGGHMVLGGSGLLLLTAALMFNAPAMGLLAIYSGLLKATDVLFEGRLQAIIPSDQRATLGSVKSFGAQIALTGLYMSFGPLAQATSYQVAFGACGLAAIVLGLGGALLSPRRSAGEAA